MPPPSLWDLGFDTIYAHQDREDDAADRRALDRAAVRRAHAPVPRRVYAGAIVLLALAGGSRACRAGSSRRWPCRRRLLAWQVVRLDIDDPAGCLRLFRFNREAGLLVAAAILAGWSALTRPGSVRPRPHAARLRDAWCRRSRCIWRARSRRSGRRREDFLRTHGLEPAVLGLRLAGRAGAGAASCWTIPERVAGRRVLDFAAGCGHRRDRLRAGRGGVGAERPRSTRSRAPRSLLNAALNGVAVEAGGRRSGRRGLRAGTCVLCGDVCYEAPMTAQIMPWLRRMAAHVGGVARRSRPRLSAARGAGRSSPRYRVPTTLELEDRTEREVGLYRVMPSA